MRQYRFSICYENASYPGWLTEKMLDAMFAGSVPVYLGDPEVAKLVPTEAFIDKRLFLSNWVYDSFAIVDTSPVAHVHVMQANRLNKINVLPLLPTV